LKFALIILSFICSLNFQSQLVFAQTVAIDLETAQADPDFALQGEYQTGATSPKPTGVQVVALGKGSFRVVIYEGGLPGDGWNRKPAQIMTEEETDAVQELLEALNVKKMTRQSKSIGAKPPEGAVVLFDGSKETFDQHWQAGSKITDEGLLEQGARTTDLFQDFVAHVEFMTPYMPEARGQGRGNSGIYYQGRYETQVLDSFGLEGKNNETGGIYEIRDPDLNMCFPPLTWQTYDVEFTAARFDEDGKKTSNAKLTVRLNGVVVQRDVEVPRITRAAPLNESADPGPLYIQNHGNPVRFRNIWVLARDAEKEARRPRIPGFERFHATAVDSKAGGALLIGELGCLNCHSGNKEISEFINTKQAPILSEVGKRVQPDWMIKFIADPHGTKAGTTMPNLFNGWEEDKKNHAVQALTNFLASTGQPANQSNNLQAAKKGEKLFHEVGCVACHAPRDGKKVSEATSVPLANLQEKYTVNSLMEFLKNPHSVRPSGRMPSLNLKDKEPEELAHYLAGGGKSHQIPNVNYTVYHGSWQKLPEFAELKPVSTGTSAGLDLSVAGRNNDFAVIYEAYLLVKVEGEYTFWIGSDDGSALFIDGKELINVDGIHPHTTKEGKVALSTGVHKIRVEYFEQGGEETLALDLQPPGGPKQSAGTLLTLNEDGSPVEIPKLDTVAEDAGLAFHRDPDLIAEGRELFTTLGCANCHQMKVGDETLNGKKSVEFAKVQAAKGCLGSSPTTQNEMFVPDFELSPGQQLAIDSVIEDQSVANLDAKQQIQRTMTQFNCFACHERNGAGGPEFDRNLLFLTTQHEMGDEGRVPPPLNGVGDKLKENWLKEILDKGANDRPYMLTRMPQFGKNNIGHLAGHFIQEDLIEEAELASFDEPLHRIQATGRELVGDQALACIKCHTFGPHKATGIQAISLTEMKKRVREDWFLRYLFEPAKYRPGTRMPTGFPNGQASIRTIYEGDPSQQISAVWSYLQDGDKAGIPDGLIAKMIELKPEGEPIIYRNFLEGVGPRGIAVGYPEAAHLAWDANELCLKLIWHNRFIDASKHWVGRGQGNQVPLGDHLLRLDESIPVASLSSEEAAWPTESVRDRDGFQFKGYNLNSKGQPTFVYQTSFATISDFPKPVPGDGSDASFERTITVTKPLKANPIYFRAAVGNKIEPIGNGFRIDGAMTITLQGDVNAKPFIRESNGRQELLMLMPIRGSGSTITQRIDW
jgi:mono/diheme cytochrome c family protein